ncbi:hypothetical protein BDQ12DRAFT_162569 [Crucibulum laeve]|uniref:MARVEL domain-containing protein n=1 Tax=Crucibulum laeve TaxID=68775 RepID=A0A5C3MDP4_9AGAR|nr:hypothetical protein BDQ12DRAFT_162569 [Crucibulum laeve]
MAFSHSLPMIRLAVLSAVTILSLIVLALCAHLLSFTNKFLGAGTYFTFSALGLATALLSLLTLPVMIFIDFKRNGAFTSLIAVELGWLGFLWVMWLATAGTTASSNAPGTSCSNFIISEVKTACSELQAVEAFAFLSWIALFFYFISLLVFSAVASSKGNGRVWFGTVKETDFNADSVHNHGEKAGVSVNQVPMTVTPAAQYTGQPQYPPQQGLGQPAQVHPSYPQV